MDRGPVWEEGEPASLPTAPVLPPHLGGMDFLGRREPSFEGGVLSRLGRCATSREAEGTP